MHRSATKIEKLETQIQSESTLLLATASVFQINFLFYSTNIYKMPCSCTIRKPHKQPNQDNKANSQPNKSSYLQDKYKDSSYSHILQTQDYSDKYKLDVQVQSIHKQLQKEMWLQWNNQIAFCRFE